MYGVYFLPAENTLIKQIKSINQTLPKYTLPKVAVVLNLVSVTGPICYIVCECRCSKVFAMILFSTVNIRHPVLINTFKIILLKLLVGIEGSANKKLIDISDNMHS